MLNKKDVWIGLFIILFFGVAFISAALLMTTVDFDGLSVSQKRIGIIEITGPIISPMPYVQKLERYIKNDNIPAIVIRLNTPGGGVAASQEVYETVKKARRAGKKIVASMGSVAASGGYYIAAACDTIVANPGTITGSIGVIVNYADFSELFDKIGVDFQNRKSGKYKDMGSASRKMTDDEKALLDSVVMDTHEQFIGAVSEGRNISLDEVRSFSDGRIFSGRQAAERGLVDEMGTYQDAIDIAGKMVGLGENPQVLKEKRDFFEEFFLKGISGVQRLRAEYGIPRLLYILN